MLGRYIAGTLLILGVVMAVAPDNSIVSDVEVSRSDTAPMALATARTDPASDPVKLISLDQTSGALAAPARSGLPQADTGLIAAVTGTSQVTPASGADLSRANGADLPRANGADLAGGRVDVTLPATQIGGIATLAGLEPAPAPTRVDAPATTQTLPAATQRPDYHYVTGSRVNVRSGPSTDYRVVSRVIRGDSVEVIDRPDDEWVEIRIVGSDDTGYMAERFLSRELDG